MPKSFKDWGIKVRKFEDKNYHAVWCDLVTLRLGSGIASQLDFPEFYDVAINSNCNALCPFCFLSGTKVKDKYGYKNIENISKGDLVWTKNEKSLLREIKPVEQLHKREYDGEVITIETESGKFTLTPNHKVFIVNKGWVEAQYIQEDDDIEMFDIAST